LRPAAGRMTETEHGMATHDPAARAAGNGRGVMAVSMTLKPGSACADCDSQILPEGRPTGRPLLDPRPFASRAGGCPAGNGTVWVTVRMNGLAALGAIDRIGIRILPSGAQPGFRHCPVMGTFPCTGKVSQDLHGRPEPVPAEGRPACAGARADFRGLRQRCQAGTAGSCGCAGICPG